MVFLIEATQNRNVAALHLKLDELLRAVGKARTGLVGLENLPEEELKEVQAEFRLAGQICGAPETALGQRAEGPLKYAAHGRGTKAQTKHFLSQEVPMDASKCEATPPNRWFGGSKR